MIVTKSVATPLDHFSAAALTVTLSLLMDDPVKTLMNAHLAHMIMAASSNV